MISQKIALNAYAVAIAGVAVVETAFACVGDFVWIKPFQACWIAQMIDSQEETTFAWVAVGKIAAGRTALWTKCANSALIVKISIQSHAASCLII